MARPAKEGLDYFSHDTDAVNDEKLEALRALHGNDGYAFFFILCERIYRSPNSEIDVSDAETLQILARKVSVTMEKFLEMMETALKWHCFNAEKYRNHHILTSNGIKKRALPVLKKREEMRLIYQKGQVSTPISDTETRNKPDKVKNSKVKNSKEINKSKYGEFKNVLLSNEEYGKLMERFGEKDAVSLIESLSCGISSKGYKYKSHYAAILSWDRLNRERVNETHQQGTSRGFPERYTKPEEL